MSVYTARHTSFTPCLHVYHGTYPCALAQLARQTKAAQAVQRAYRTRRARYMVRELMLVVFEKRVDPRTGEDFYFNRRTGESQWEAPKLAKQLVCA